MKIKHQKSRNPLIISSLRLYRDNKQRLNFFLEFNSLHAIVRVEGRGF